MIYTDGSESKEGTGAEVYVLRPGLRHLFPLGQYAIVFQAELMTKDICVKENIKRAFDKTRIQTVKQQSMHLQAQI